MSRWDWDARIGADPERWLQAYREQVDKVHAAGLALAKVKAELAQLAARHGGGKGQQSHFEYERKAKYSEIAEGRRGELLRAGEKVVEAALESYAHAHPAYLAFLEHARSERARYEALQAKLSEAFADLEHAKGVEAYLAARIQVVRSQLYAFGQEAGLTRG